MSNLGFGLHLTLIGMSLVFGLLGLLWLLLVVVGKIDGLLPAGDAEAGGRQTAKAGPLVVSGVGAHELDPELLAAVAIAIAAHVATLRREAAPTMRATQPGSQLFASRWLAAGRTRQTRGWIPRR